jgi:hypothetical protein
MLEVYDIVPADEKNQTNHQDCRVAMQTKEKKKVSTSSSQVIQL